MLTDLTTLYTTNKHVTYTALISLSEAAVFFLCSFFTAVIYTHVNKSTIHFHLYHSVNVY